MSKENDNEFIVTAEVRTESWLICLGLLEFKEMKIAIRA